MIDEEQMKHDFIERRKKYNLHRKPKKEPLNENPPLMIVSYNNGLGKMVIDEENFHKLPKKSQKKILELMGCA